MARDVPTLAMHYLMYTMHEHTYTHIPVHTHMQTHMDALYLCWPSRAVTRLRVSESAWGRVGPLRGKKRKGSGYLEGRMDGALSLPEGGRSGGLAVNGEERDGEDAN